jgi:hypothetical protein
LRNRPGRHRDVAPGGPHHVPTFPRPRRHVCRQGVLLLPLPVDVVDRRSPADVAARPARPSRRSSRTMLASTGAGEPTRTDSVRRVAAISETSSRMRRAATRRSLQRTRDRRSRSTIFVRVMLHVIRKARAEPRARGPRTGSRRRASSCRDGGWLPARRHTRRRGCPRLPEPAPTWRG